MVKVLEISEIKDIVYNVQSEPILIINKKNSIFFFIERGIKWDSSLEYPEILESEDNCYILKYDEGISKIVLTDNKIEVIPYLQFHRKQTLFCAKKKTLVLLDRTEGVKEDIRGKFFIFLSRIIQMDIEGNLISKSELLDIGMLPYFAMDFMVFIDSDEEKKIHLFNLAKNKIDWIFNLEKFESLCQDKEYIGINSNPRVVEINEEFIIVNSSHGVGALSTAIGELLWFNEGVMLEKTQGKYVALTECFYREYNPVNGEIIRELNVEAEFIEKSFSPSMYDFKMIDDVYLVGVQRMYNSKVILLNTETGKIDWKYEFRDADGDFIRLKGDPLRIFGNRIYVHDLENTLHVFEK